MTRLQILALATVLAASMTIPAQQSAAQTKMTLRPESNLTLSGSSNVHDWSCKSSSFQATVELDSAYQTEPFTAVPKLITRVSVTIPVKSLKCGHGKMDDNMYKALNAEQFPDIRYVLGSYTVNKAETTESALAATTVGDLTVSGKTIRAEIPLVARRMLGGSMVGQGSIKLLMTDFGIKPPVALLGTLRTKNEIEISFQVLLDKSVVVALSRQ